MNGTVRVAVAARLAQEGPWAIAAVVCSEGSRHVRTVTRRLRRKDRVPPVYRAALLGLWEARRVGATTVELCVDDAEVVAQIVAGAPPAEAGVAYLQIKALANTFVAVEFRCVPPAANQQAIFAAEAALHCARPVYEDLPLWAAAS